MSNSASDPPASAGTPQRSSSVPPMPTGIPHSPLSETGSAQEASAADSDKTIIAHPRRRVMAAQPGSGAALFSTDGGRLPLRRNLLPPAPIIVRSSDNILAVVHVANTWRVKDEYLYNIIFPCQGWTIEDLWDQADIHIETPAFLREVLYFIGHDNARRAALFMQKWCQKNPDKVDILGQDIGHLDSPDDKYAVVDSIFTDGEIEQHPPQFLYEALAILRCTMRFHKPKSTQNQQSASSKPTTNVGARTNGNGAGNNSLPNVGVTSVPGPAYQHPPMSGRPGPAHSVQSPPQPPVTAMGPPVATVVLPVRHPSLSAHQTPRPSFSQMGPVPMGHQPTVLPCHNKVLNRARRPARSGSGTYPQPPQMHGTNENTRMPSGGHLRQSSGHMRSPYLNQVMPVVPGMLNPPFPGQPLPPFPAVASPSMSHGQLHFSPGFPPGAIIPHSGPFPPSPNQPIFAHFGGSGAQVQRAGQFADMSNNAQFSPSMRNAGPRRSSQSNGNNNNRQVGLYNPYGSERPDKAGFATMGPPSSGRRGDRNTFSGNADRSRINSAGTFDRFGRGFPSNSAHSDRWPADSQYGQSFQPNGPPSAGTPFPWLANEHIMNEPEFGCGTNWIGPKNTVVTQLHLVNFDEKIHGEEIVDAFIRASGVTPMNVELKRGSYDDRVTHAFATFATVDEARQALKTDGQKIRDKEMYVSVAKRYFYSARQNTQVTYRHNKVGAKPASSIYYSPQDVRSQVQDEKAQHEQELAETNGSPKASKATKNLSVKKTRAAHEKTSGVQTKEPSSAKVTEFAKSSKDTAKRPGEEQELADRQNEPNSESDHIAKTDEVVSSGAAQLVPVDTPALNTGGEEPKEEATRDTLPSPTKRCRAVPIAGMDDSASDTNASFLHSPTDVVLSSQSSPPSLHGEDARNQQQAEDKQKQHDEDAHCQQDNDTYRQQNGDLKHEQGKDKHHLQDKNEQHLQDQEATGEAARTASKPTDVLEETTSDDDQKNDLSFHSAHESQPDGENTEAQTSITEKNERSEATVFEPAVTEDSHVKDVADENKSTQQPQSEPDMSATHLPDPNAKEEIVETAPEKGLDPIAERGAIDVSKKLGAKRTESLHPFAKPSKSQLKKERQAKRKDKTKDKEKPKAEGEGGGSQDNKNVVNAKGTDEKDVRISVPAIKTEDGLRKGESGDLVRLQGMHSSPSKTPAAGKQSSEVQLPVTTSLETAPHGELVNAASSDSKPNAKMINLSLPEPATTKIAASPATPPRESAPARAAEKKTKAVPPKIAVPNIANLNQRTGNGKSVPASANEPPNTAYFSVNSSPPGKSSPPSSVTATPSKQKTQVPHGTSSQNDAASVTSSSTLRGASPPSSSPPAKAFHTPLQTPSTPVATPPEGGKKKKPKRKKKNKSAATSEGAFHDQLSQIADTQSGYYALRGQDLPEKEELEPRKEDKSAKSLIRQMHAYVKGKTASYARLSESTWSKERKNVEKMTPKEMRQVITGHPLADSSATNMFVQDGLLPDDDAEKVGKAGTRPHFGE